MSSCANFADDAQLRWLGNPLAIVGYRQGALQGRTTMGTAKTEMVRVGDIDIAYQERGRGEPIILIMGLTGTMDLWAPKLLEELAKSYRTIIFDNRGMGYTTASDKEFSIELFAADTAGFMDGLGIEHAHILGWSMGTYVAQELVLNHPDKVDKLILYGADCGGERAIYPDKWILDILKGDVDQTEDIGMLLLTTLFPPEWMKANPDPTAYFPMPMETTSAENLARQYAAWQKWGGSYSRLSRISKPTLLITGTDDINTPWQNSLIMVEHIPEAWLVQFKGGGHGVMYQYPKEFSRVLLTFLET